MTPHEKWVARTMLARGWELFAVEEVLGMEPKHKRRPSGRANRVTPDEVKRMVEMRAQGMSYTRIGVMMGRDHSCVSYWCRKVEIEKEGRVMCGYTDHSDGRLIPPNISDSGEPSPEEAYILCCHNGACLGQHTQRLPHESNGFIAEILGCKDCEEWREDLEPELKGACKALVSRLRYAEQQLDVELLDARLASTLKELGVEYAYTLR